MCQGRVRNARCLFDAEHRPNSMIAFGLQYAACLGRLYVVCAGPPGHGRDSGERQPRHLQRVPRRLCRWSGEHC